MIGLVKRAAHQEPALVQVILSLRVNALVRCRGSQVCIRQRGALILKNYVILPAMEIGNSELRPIALITRLYVERAYCLGNEIGIPL